MWEKPAFLIQLQQGIKSTLCLCVMGGFAGVDRSLDRKLRHQVEEGPTSQSPLSNPPLSCLPPPSAKHHPRFIDLVHTFFYMKTEKAPGISSRASRPWLSHCFPDFLACDPLKRIQFEHLLIIPHRIIFNTF